MTRDSKGRFVGRRDRGMVTKYRIQRLDPAEFDELSRPLADWAQLFGYPSFYCVVEGESRYWPHPNDSCVLGEDEDGPYFTPIRVPVRSVAEDVQ
jgi:hypothetical protein